MVLNHKFGISTGVQLILIGDWLDRIRSPLSALSLSGLSGRETLWEQAERLRVQ